MLASTGIALAACALPSVDEYSRGADAIGDAGREAEVIAPDADSTPAEAGIDAGTIDATTPAGTNLLPNGDFEQQACSTFFLGQGGATSDAHGGSSACQVCRKNESIDFYTFNPLPLVRSPVIGKTYRARAWVKRGPESFKDQQVQVVLRLANDHPAGWEVVDERGSGLINLTNEWQLVETSFTVTKSAALLDTFVAAETLATAGQRCVVIDDYEVGEQ